MTNDELEAVRARAEAATAGPWEWRWDAILGQWSLAPGVLLADGTDGTPGGDKIDVENAEFIAHARTDIPALLDDVAEWRQAASVEANQRREAEARATRAEAHAERLKATMREISATILAGMEPDPPYCESCESAGETQVLLVVQKVTALVSQALAAYRGVKDEACSRPPDALDAPVADQSTTCSQPERT